jgi:subtilase family serine protease
MQIPVVEKIQGEVMIRRMSISLLTVVALLAIVSVVCQAESLPLLTRHVREVTVNGQAPSIGRLPATQSMRIDIVLPLRDQAGLDRFLQAVYDPSSPLYRQFLTVREFTQRFGPTRSQYDSLVRFAEANGFTVVGGSRDAMDVQLKGSVENIESTFHVNLGVYQHPTENRNFYAPDREPTIDLPFQLWHITGLDNYSIPRPALARNPDPAHSKATTGSCPDQSFCGSDMRGAYYGGSALTGSGQNIGLLEYAGFDITDVNTYYKNAGQTRTATVTGISTDGTPLSCLYPVCDDTEQTIDITQALGMAPGVTTVYMYVGSSDTALLGAMSSDTPLPAQLSASWIWSPSDPSTDDPYFMKMASQGQNYFQASGDDGKFNAGYPTWPCDSAYVTSVGGTDLETSSPGGPWMSETAWSDGGGGYWAPDDILIPSWQKATAKGCAECSQTYRNAPDVAANANFTFYVCADQSACSANEYGGTSFAAPMWAGYLALYNQKEAAAGHKSVGFINPAIYRVGLSAGYDNDFHDITSGSNGYSATKGYDLATGWGSPKAGNGIVGDDQ